MKTTQITYGVIGLIDWKATIPIGKATLNIHFTGGAMTKYGITPAEFATSDPIVQHIIENSDYFRSHRIVRLRTTAQTTANTPKKK